MMFLVEKHVENDVIVVCLENVFVLLLACFGGCVSVA